MSLAAVADELEVSPLHGRRLVVVDDEPSNLLLLDRLLGRWGFTDIVTTTDPDDAIALCRSDPPDLLLLDLQMPGTDGFAVLAALEGQIRAPLPLAVLVLTADVTADTKRRALAEGARDFLTKPFDPEEVRLRVLNLLEVRHLQVQHAQYEARLEATVEERTAQLEQARLDVVERLALAAEFRDDETGEHTRRVGAIAARLGRVLGMDEEQVDLLLLAAPLHDVGKIAVPDAILLKPARLTGDEFRAMQTHTTVGARLLSGTPSVALNLAAEIAISHHERWDGSGYPRGLRGSSIPQAGRIVALADVFDALTHDRPYKSAWPVEQARAEVEAQRGRHFDPDVADAFLALP